MADDRPIGGDLARLLAAEDRFEADLAAAREEAKRLIAAAEADARAAAAEAEQAFTAKYAALAQRLDASRDGELRALRDAAKRRVAALDAIGDEWVEAKAGWIVDRVVGVRMEGAP